jgi:hypothetical protein
MAKLSFIRGAATGKMGEFVGAKWKGINYIRLYAKPSNPRTEGQISIRLVFKALSQFASALFGIGLLQLIPPVRRMTERNTIFKVNKKMLTDKTFRPNELKLSKPNYPVQNAPIVAAINGSKIRLANGFYIETADPDLLIHCFTYDFVKGVIVSYFNNSWDLMKTATGFEMDKPDNFDTPEGSLKANCRAFAVFTSVSEEGKMLISDTFSCPID